MAHDSEEKVGKQRSWIEKLTALFGREPKDKNELMELLRDAESRTIISEEVLNMIARIFQVSEMQAREVMVPKSQMVMIEKNSNLDHIVAIFNETGHSRFPVYDPADGNISGIILAKDVLKFFKTESEDFNIEKILRPAVFTSQSKRLDVLLREFRINHNHLAIVLDEYGFPAGLITIEDVLEQIVGEIEDEYDIDDEDDSYIKQLSDEIYIVKAQTPIEEFNDYFQTDYEDEEFDTIGGIILQKFGHLPKRGESLRLPPYRFKVLNSDNRRLYLLEVKKKKKTSKK